MATHVKHKQEEEENMSELNICAFLKFYLVKHNFLLLNMTLFYRNLIIEYVTIGRKKIT
jgi:hypothetical protein